MNKHCEVFDKIVQDSNINSMTEIIAKVINEKSLKTNSTLIHWINWEFKQENIDENNTLLIWKLLKSKDM